MGKYVDKNGFYIKKSYINASYRLPVFPPHVKVLLETRRNSMDYMPGTANRIAVLDVVTGALQKQGLM